MAKSAPELKLHEEPAIDIDLKNRGLAAFLAWLLPGMGHIYQGRTGKGVLFFVCIVGTFLFGLYIGQGRVVYAASANPFSRQFLERWQYLCQVGVGLPALPALVQTVRIERGDPPLREFMRPPRRGDFRSPDLSGHEVRHPDELAMWNHDLGDMFEMGTVFTVIAGLLNVLVIYDAYGGPLIIPPPEDKKKRDDKLKPADTDAK